MSSDNDYKRFKVSIKSVPGFYAQYSGDVEVFAKDVDDAVDTALTKLKRGAFQDRTNDMWRVVSVECLDF